ncbi:class I SAM-dependent methyltransferase [Aestuariispira insulae]|uniref:Methyltransferase family protein n=1 Tax=Aestuariispira insulae TaxID=1461337 RepID=A0A3D9H5I3_9PROT|nr:class I SAM-dependent methyltransferase [Aestuariispira insulae]RED44689.1 methyltransferase family protein [Aestuariispira insulae]
MAAAYDPMASWYAAIHGDKHEVLAHFQPLVDLLEDRLEKGRVLDVGCGIGLMSRVIAASGAYQVVGIDPSEASIQEARRSQAADVADIEYRQCDVLNLDPELGQFDAIICTNGLLAHLEDESAREAAVSRLIERLSPGGWLFLPQYDTAWLLNEEAHSQFSLPRVCEDGGQPFVYLRRTTWPGRDHDLPQELEMLRIDDDGAVTRVEVPLKPVSNGQLAKRLQALNMERLEWLAPEQTGYDAPVCICRKPGQETLLHYGENWYPITVHPAAMEENPFEEEPGTVRTSLSVTRTEGRQRLVTRRKQVTLVMFSGGIDSVYALDRLLRESDDEIIAHHLHMMNLEGRDRAEDRACREIIEYLRHRHRDFIYTESAVDRRKFLGFGMDDVTVAFEAGAISRSFAHVRGHSVDRWTTGTCLEEELEDLSKEDLSDDEHLGHMLNATEAASFPHLPPRYFQLPIIPKADQMAYMGQELVDLCWTCRTPEWQADGMAVECGKCKTCELMGLVRSGQQTIPD